MYPYLKADLERGIYTKETALDLLEDFFLSFNLDSDTYVGVQQGDNGQSMMLGGVDENGNDVFNLLSELCLKASYNNKMIDPKINLRVDKNTPKERYTLASHLTKAGLGFPQYSNDDVVMPALEKLGYSHRDAADYTVAACWEFIIPFVGADVANIGALSYPKAVDTVLHRDFLDCDTYDEFFGRVRQEIFSMSDAICEGIKDLWFVPAPFMNVLMDCDIYTGGKYNNFGIHGTGIATAADSLAAIKKYVYEDRELLNGRVKEDIEKHRKGERKLRFVDQAGKPVAGKKIVINQTGHDFRYGANMFMLDEFDDAVLNERYRESFPVYFNSATVPFYWKDLEPERGKPRYEKDSPRIYRRPAPDLCMEYCEEKHILPKIHCMVYDKFIPDWLPKNDMEAMEKLYEERFRQISERYAGRVFEVEVINELLSEGSWTTQSVISTKPDVCEWAFSLAKKYFPGETLVINDGNYLESIAREDYRSIYYLLAENAPLKGTAIDKIGIQHHCYTGATEKTEEEYEQRVKEGSGMFIPSNILKGLDVMASLARPIEITEITIPTFGETPGDEELQADLLERFYTLLFSHPSVDTAVYWNLPDGYAYEGIGWNENKCRGGLFHHDMTPKRSAERLYELFREKWHTALELTTDENGCVAFRGFYGEYDTEINGKKRRSVCTKTARRSAR